METCLAECDTYVYYNSSVLQIGSTKAVTKSFIAQLIVQ